MENSADGLSSACLQEKIQGFRSRKFRYIITGYILLCTRLSHTAKARIFAVASGNLENCLIH